MMPEDQKTLTIAVRTRKNLKYIYKKKSQNEDVEDVEEFTQLLNSMLGIVICLREDYFKGKHISWEDEDVRSLETLQGRNDLKNTTGKPGNHESPYLQKVNSFSQLVTKLRHAFAHNCFDLIPDGSNQIAGITVWNTPPNRENTPENRIWEADILEKELKDLAYLIVEYIEKKHGELGE